MTIFILDKNDEKLWTEYIQKKENATAFHTLEWRNAIEKTHGYKPVYLISKEDGQINGILPLFIVKSLGCRKKLCSNPFSFYSDFLFDNEGIGIQLIEKAISLAQEESAILLELKPVDKMDDNMVAKLDLINKNPYIITRLELPDSVEKLKDVYEKRLTKNLRTTTRNFEREGFKIRFMKDIKELSDFHNVLVKEFRSKHMLICQPFLLLKNIYNKLYQKKMMDLLLVEKNGKVLAGIVLLFFNKSILYFMGASDQEYRRYSFNTLLVDYAIKWSCEHGYKKFDFGPSSPSMEKLIYFKDRWGSKSTELSYYYKLFKTDKAPEPIDFINSYKHSRKIVKYIPLWLIKLSLPYVVKHLESPLNLP